MEIVQFPSHIVNPTKEIDAVFVCRHSMTAANNWFLSTGLFNGLINILLQIEGPQIIEPFLLGSSAEHVNFSIVVCS
jgi:hypothetical protein